MHKDSAERQGLNKAHAVLMNENHCSLKVSTDGAVC